MKPSILISALLSALCMLCCLSCVKEAKGVDTPLDNTSCKVVLSVRTQSVPSADNTAAESRLDRIDIYSFVKFPGTAEYTFEKQFENLALTNSTTSFELVGNLPRQLYYIANDVSGKIDYLKTLTSSSTSSELVENSVLVDATSPQFPLILSGVNAVESFASTSNLDVELSYAAARVDVVYRYEGFTADSLFVREAASGAVIFTPELPVPTTFPSEDVRYEVGAPIYLYPSNDAVLTIYGKFDNVRVVFDIPLGAVKPATRYNVTVRSKDDIGFDFAGNLVYDVKEWNPGDNIDSQPDWQ